MESKLSKIKMLLLDVDGVLTDGSVTYTDAGEQIKQFNAKDGLGLRLLMDSNIKVGIITGRTSKALHHRCKNLGISLIFDGIKDKSRVLSKITTQTGIDPEHIAFVGDDLIDLGVMKRVGLPICVADAAQDVICHAHIVTKKGGGQGAVREVCEQILKAKGLWDNILDKYAL
ncbi:MAG: HAD-IIIA family hydrolase [Desulfobacula sp.]|nr:HAD-IIIA family hydrolase [Desulfobacula sp.]